MQPLPRTCAPLLMLVVLALGGCASDPRGAPDLLDFLRDGATLREDAHLRLGEPSAQYESGRILAFRLARDQGGLYCVTPGEWSPDSYSLILVFDAKGVLSRHSLVQVRYP